MNKYVSRLRSMTGIGRMLMLVGMFTVMASAQVAGPWTNSVTAIDSMFSTGYAQLAGIAICILGLGTFVFGEGRGKMAAIVELCLGFGIVAAHQALSRIF